MDARERCFVRFRNGVTPQEINARSGPLLEYTIGEMHILALMMCPMEFERDSEGVHVPARLIQKMCSMCFIHEPALLRRSPCAFVAGACFLTGMFATLENRLLRTRVVGSSVAEFIVHVHNAARSAGGITMTQASVHWLDLPDDAASPKRPKQTARGTEQVRATHEADVSWFETMAIDSMRVVDNCPLGYGDVIMLLESPWKTSARREVGGAFEKSLHALISAASTGTSDRTKQTRAMRLANWLTDTELQPPLLSLPRIDLIPQELARRQLGTVQAHFEALRHGWKCFTPIAELIGDESFEVALSHVRTLLAGSCTGQSLSSELPQLAARVWSVLGNIETTSSLATRVAQAHHLMCLAAHNPEPAQTLMAGPDRAELPTQESGGGQHGPDPLIARSWIH